MRFLPVQGVTAIVLLFLLTVSVLCYVTNVCIHSSSEVRRLAMSSRGGNTSSLYKLCMAPPSCYSCKNRPSPCASTKSSSCQWNRTQRNSPFRHRSTAVLTSFEIFNGNGTQTERKRNGNGINRGTARNGNGTLTFFCLLLVKQKTPHIVDSIPFTAFAF